MVSDFRPADMAAGGKGAPLVPFLDYLCFRHTKRGRMVQNLGGIGNLTAIPPGATPEEVVAFDTGPANMVIDAVTEELFGCALRQGWPHRRPGRTHQRRDCGSLCDYLSSGGVLPAPRDARSLAVNSLRI